MSISRICLNINGVNRFVLFDPDKDTLANVLRRLGLTGTKIGCGTGVCGACSVILNGKVIRSCTKKMSTVSEFSEIITIEGIGTPMNLHPLQIAWIYHGGVQCGFCTPGFIVSAYQLLQENLLPTREEVRQWFYKHRNICRCTGYKPLVDAVMDAAKIMRGEMSASQLTDEWTEIDDIYGSKYPRPSALAKVCGVCDYGDDIKMQMPEETLHVAVVQPRITHHANIINIDYSEASRMPGVVKIITASDIKGTNRLDAPLGHKHAKGSKGFDRPIICDNKIYRYGDVVALVVARTEKEARNAAKAVKVKIEELPAYLDLLDAVAPGALQIHEEMPNTYLYQPTLKGDGDTRDIIDKSKYVVEGSFFSSREPHLTIEGDVMQAYYDEDGILTVQCKSQFLYLNLWSIPRAIGTTADKMRFICNPAGGSFGWSLSVASYALVAVAALEVQAPVTLSMSYEEFMHFSGKRAPAYINSRLACNEEGKITALEFDTAIDHGAYSDNAQTLIDRFCRFFGFPYGIPQVTGLSRMCCTNHAFGVAYRGYGAPQCTTAMESLMDMLAEKVGISPWEIRHINAARPGDTMISSYPFMQYPMVELLEKAKPIYDAAVARARSADTPEKRRGVGIACTGYNTSAGGGDRASCKLVLNDDDSISLYNTWQDLGQGGDIGCVTHMVDAFKDIGLRPDQVRLCFNDTKTCPNSGLSGGSRSHYMNGHAIRKTAKKMLDVMRRDDGTYRRYEDMVNEGLPIEFEEEFNLNHYGLVATDPDTGKGSASPTYMYAVFVSEVEVDVKTGKVKTLSMVSVDDVGVIGNRLAVDGQAYGGMSHSIGFALTENYHDVKKHNNMAGAGVPTILDIPDNDNFLAIHIENPREDGPRGSAGCSEVFQSCAHVAILNAIYDACGVRIHELPAYPEKIKDGLAKIASGEASYVPKPYYIGTPLYEMLEELKEDL